MGIPRQVAELDEQANKALEEDMKAIAEGGAQTTVAQPEPKAEVAEPKKPDEAKPDVADAKPDGVANILSNVPVNRDGQPMAPEGVKLWTSRIDAAHKERDEARRQADEVRSQLASKDEEIERLKAELAQAAERNVQTSALSEDVKQILKKKLGDGYSDEELQNFAEAIGVLTDIRTKGLREELEANRRRDAQSSADAFKARLEGDFPGFLAMDAKNDPAWVEFLGSSVGGVDGITYADVAKDAAQRMDYRRFSSVVRAFQKATGHQFSPDGQIDPRIAAQMRPRSVAGKTTTQRQTPNVFARSEVAKFYRAYQARRAEETYGLTRQQVAERIRLYEDAEAEGRIDETR